MRAALIFEKAPFEEVMALDTEVVAEDPEMAWEGLAKRRSGLCFGGSRRPSGTGQQAITAIEFLRIRACDLACMGLSHRIGSMSVSMRKLCRRHFRGQERDEIKWLACQNSSILLFNAPGKLTRKLS